jgi:signal transduction histidine kinase
MLALLQAMLWLSARDHAEYLISALMAAAAGCVALLELAAMSAADAPTYLDALKLQITFIGIMLISLVWFVRIYLSAGSPTLVYATIVLWAIALVANLVSPTGGLFTSNVELVSRQFLGETFTLLRGETNPWKYAADAASVLILLFLLQATVEAWRKNKRQRAVVVGGSSLVFIMFGGIHTPLVDAGVIQTPYMVGFSFLAIVGALSYQLVYDALQANRYAREMEQLTRAFLLGEIAAGLAHELNQPLAAILSNAQAARRYLGSSEPDYDEVGEIIEDIIAEDKRAGQIIHGLRTMLRGADPETRVVSINDVIESTIDLVGADLRSRGVAIQTDLRATRDAVEADSVQLQQVLINLMLNAAKAMAETTPDRRRIGIRSTSRGEKIDIAVTDRGPGIREPARARLFEPFFSTDASGLGMGLPICKRIVERHGGRIWMEPRESGGSVFFFELPAAGAAAAELP